MICFPFNHLRWSDPTISHHMYLDHLFIITTRNAPEAERLKAFGFIEGSSNPHPGQGTANRRFFFEGFTLELLFVDDEEEAKLGAGKDLKIYERYTDCRHSPFGLVARVANAQSAPTFPNWHYYPDYFHGKMCFHVGNNSHRFNEPLCICMPQNMPPPKPIPKEYSNANWVLTRLEMHAPIVEPSTELQTFAQLKEVSLHTNHPHHVVLEFNKGVTKQCLDCSPDLPLSIRH